MEFTKGYVYNYKTKNGQKRFYYQIQVGRDKFGEKKWKKKRGFRRKKDAEMALSVVENEMMTGEYFKQSSILFKDYIYEWLNDKQYDISSSTFNSYNNVINNQIMKDNNFLNKEISKITREDIREFYIEKVEKELSNSYLEEITKIIRQVFKFALHNDKIVSNPSDGIKMPKSIKEEEIDKDFKVWTKEEVNEFLELTKNERMYPAFLLLLHTGMRRGEVLALTWKDVDLKRGIINIDKALKRKKKSGFYIGEPKSVSSYREVVISKRITKVLEKLRLKQEEADRMIGVESSVDDMVVQNTVRRTQDPRNLKRVKDRIVKKHNLRNITIHDFRHTHASLLLEAGMEPTRVQKRLGHSKLSTTLDTYAHAIPRKEDDIGDRFDDILNV